MSVQAVFADGFDVESFLGQIAHCYAGGQIYQNGVCVQCEGEDQIASNGEDECYANCDYANYLQAGGVCRGDTACINALAPVIIERNLCQKCVADPDDNKEDKYYLKDGKTVIGCVTQNDCNSRNMIAKKVEGNPDKAGVCESCPADTVDKVYCFSANDNACIDINEVESINAKRYRDSTGKCAVCVGYTVPKEGTTSCVTMQECTNGYGMNNEGSGINGNTRCVKCGADEATMEISKHTGALAYGDTPSLIFANNICWGKTWSLREKTDWADTYMTNSGNKWVHKEASAMNCTAPKKPVWVDYESYYNDNENGQNIYYFLPGHFECETCENGIWEEDSTHTGGWKCTACAGIIFNDQCYSSCADLNMNDGCSVDSTGQLIGVPLGGFYFENDGSRSSVPAFCAKTAGEGTDMCWMGNNNNNTCTPCDLNNTVVNPGTTTDGRPYNEKTNTTCSEGYYITNGTCLPCKGEGVGWYETIDENNVKQQHCDNVGPSDDKEYFLAYRCNRMGDSATYSGLCEIGVNTQYNIWLEVSEENVKMAIESISWGPESGYFDGRDKTVERCGDGDITDLNSMNNGYGLFVIGDKSSDGLLYLNRECKKCTVGYNIDRRSLDTSGKKVWACSPCDSGEGPAFAKNYNSNDLSYSTPESEVNGYYTCSDKCKFEGWGIYNDRTGNKCVLCSGIGMRSVPGNDSSQDNTCEACPRGTGFNDLNKQCERCTIPNKPSYNGNCLDFTGLNKAMCNKNKCENTTQNPFRVNVDTTNDIRQIVLNPGYENNNGVIEFSPVNGFPNDNPHRYMALYDNTTKGYYWGPCIIGKDRVGYCCYGGEYIRSETVYKDVASFVLPGMACEIKKQGNNNLIYSSSLKCDSIRPGSVRDKNSLGINIDDFTEIFNNTDKSKMLNALTAYVYKDVCKSSVDIKQFCDGVGDTAVCTPLPDWLKMDGLSTQYLDYEMFKRTNYSQTTSISGEPETQPNTGQVRQ